MNKNKTQIQAILFDLDGTIIDTEPSAALAVKEIFAEWKIRLRPEDATYVTGRTWESAFTYLFGRYRIPLPEIEGKKLILKRYREALESDLQIVPGSAQAVESLAKNYPLALVSGSGRADILWALEKLNIRPHFQIILGAEDYPRSKPHPDGYLKAIQTLKIAPQNCLVFEDSTAGLTSARAAGVWVVAISSTNYFEQDLSLAHQSISDLTQVNPEWVRNLSFD